MRVRTGSTRRRKHKKIMKAARGYYAGRHKHFKKAIEQVEHSMQDAFKDRKRKKRDFRKLWIIRINAACRLNGISYSKFINGLKLAEIDLNRKVLSELAVNDAAAFTNIIELAKKARA